LVTNRIYLTFHDPEFDKNLAKKNRAVMAKLEEKGQPVVYPHIF